MPLPRIELVGNLTSDPEMTFTGAQAAMTKFRIACNERKKDPTTGEWSDGRATFVDVIAWRNLAEEVAGTLTKGEKVRVEGRLVQSNYETKDGEKRSRLEVHADSIYRPLTLGGGAPPDRGPSASRFADEDPF